MNTITKYIVLAVVGAALLSAADLAAGENVLGIVNDGGRWWRDVDGKEMVCFPNSVLKVGDTFYLYGEWCFEDENSGKNVLRCYSSKDLVRWKFENDVLTQEDSHLINRGSMLYNPTTRQYVYCYKFRRPMGFKGWKIGDGILAWATCSSPTGRFKMANKDPRIGIVAGEVTLFLDDDGKAYVVADGTFEGNDYWKGKGLNVYELSPDYCTIVKRVSYLGTGHEAISIIKFNKKYWAFASGLNGWYYSPASYRMAENITGPWTEWKVVPTDPPSPDAYKTQDGGLIFEVKGTSGSFHVWTGVRYWDTIPVGPVAAKDSAPPGARPAHIWLPLQWKDDQPLLRWYSTWNVDALKGTWSADPKTTGTPPAGPSPTVTSRTATPPTSPAPAPATSTAPLMPRIVGNWWTIAGNPDLGELTAPGQQPVDFSIWQAADGTWQLWSCIRNTRIPGATRSSRLFHRWESHSITDTNWEPKGIVFQADPRYGEEVGSIFSPFVVKIGTEYNLFYGGWVNGAKDVSKICRATSADGKTFTRVLGADGMSGMFAEGKHNFIRDPMVKKIGDTFYCYYSVSLRGKGHVFCRTSADLKTWSEPNKVAYGGVAGTVYNSAECPFLVIRDSWYYLFRTQVYRPGAQESRVYRSKDPMNFGINDDQFLLGMLPIAAPEIIEHDGQTYIASLLPSLKGIRIAKLDWGTSNEAR